MATGLLLEFQGVGEKDYERVMELLRLDENPAPGAILHTAGPIPNGWRVFNIWESRDLYEKFYNERVIPVFKQLGYPNPTRKEFYPIYNVNVRDASLLETLGTVASER